MKEETKQSAENKVVYMENGKAAVKNPIKEAFKTPLVRRLTVVALLAVIIAIILSIAASAGWLSAERISLKFFDLGKGRTAQENLPIEINGLKVLEIDGIGYCFGVLDDMKYTVYSPECNEIYSFVHNMANPVTVSSNKRVVMFERGNYKLSVFSRKGSIFTKTVENEIVSADINGKNQIAVATASERYLGQVTVFNPSGSEKLTWYSSDYYITDVCLSEDGNQFAVSLLRVENGDDISKICIFNIGEKEPIAEFAFGGDTVFDIRRTQEGFVSVGTGSAAFFNGKGEMTGKYIFEGKMLSGFTLAGDELLLNFDYITGNARLEHINLQGEKVAETAVAESDYICGSDESRFYTVNGGKITEYVKGEDGTYSVNSLKINAEAIKVLQKGEKLLILSIDGISMTDIEQPQKES